MCEPLRGKKQELYSTQTDRHGYPTRDAELINETVDNCFNNFKSAAEGFLKEIDCMNAESDGMLGGSCTIMRCDVEHLVAKWFEDVID